MMAYIAERVDDEKASRELYEFIEAEDYDSDAVQLDADAVPSSSNLRRFARELSDVLKAFLRIYRIANRSLSTGILFWYWPWYAKKGRDEKVKKGGRYARMDFGGHTVSETFVSAHFESLKAEVVGSGFISIAEFNEHVIDKGNDYIQQEICKKMKSNPMCGMNGDDPLRYDIPNGTALSVHHLYAVIMYCDFSDFCTAFGRSFRKLKWDESIASIKDRNSRFYFVSRYLRELVQYFGCVGLDYDNYPAVNGHETGPFFSGVSVVLNVPSFALGLK